MAEPVEVTDDVLASMPLPALDDDAAKDERGGILVVGGSRETPGAVLLAALAALRVGAGRLRLAVPSSVAAALAVAVPEARVVGLPETDGGDIGAEGAADAARLAGSVRAVLVGPGVLHDEGMDAVLGAVLGADTGTVVVDAGALPALGRGPARCGGPQVLAVPNPSELAALGDDPARRLGITLACRGPATTVTTPDGRAWIDRSGGVGLATSGSGDVAAGAIAGLAARGAPPHVAAVWGARLHGLAGESLAGRIAGVGYLAREVLDELPRVLARLDRR